MEQQEIDGIIEDSIFIFDTNVLLYLYKCSFNTSKNLVELIKKVQDQVIIPYRVSDEYEKHKKAEQAKIDRKYETFTKDIKNRIDKLKNGIIKSIAETRKYDFPNSDSLETQLCQKFEDVKEVVKQYDSSLEAEKGNKMLQIRLVEALVKWFCDHGQVSERPSILDTIEYIKEGEMRYRYRMPPGYMDEEDKDKEWKSSPQKDNFEGRTRKYGDFFVWKDLLKIAKDKYGGSKHIIFVTNDEKEDWWEDAKTSGHPVKMRKELAEEYKCIVGNEKIYFLTLRRFYELFSYYYEVQDVKTQLELDYDAYVQNHVLTKYQEDIDQKVVEQFKELDWDTVAGEENTEVTDVDYDNFDVEDVNIHYDTDVEHAIYDIHLKTTTFPLHLFKIDCDGNRRLLKIVELYLACMLTIRRDLRNLDDDEMEVGSISFEVSSEKEPFEYFMEEEQNGKVDYYDALENKATE